MIANTEFVKECFNRFNELCFNGQLPPVQIIMSRAIKSLGKCEFYRKNTLFGRGKSFGYRIKITNAVDLPQNELEDIIIHEMIHYYIAYKNIDDTSSHGEIFKMIMRSINDKFGRHIDIRHKMTSDGCQDVTNITKSYILCVSTLADGTRGITVCAKTKFFEIYKKLPKYYNIGSLELFLSFDPFFNRYPRSNTAKIYRISQLDLSEHLLNAKVLEISGNILKVKKPN